MKKLIYNPDRKRTLPRYIINTEALKQFREAINKLGEFNDECNN